MVVSSIARRLAKHLDVPLAKATRFVDDVGVSRATRLADDVAAKGDDAAKTIGSWWKPGLLVGGLGGAGYALREQDIRKMRQIAESNTSTASGIEQIMDSELSADAKQQLLDMYLNRSGSGGSGGSGGPGLFDGFDNVALMLGAFIILIIVVNGVMQ